MSQLPCIINCLINRFQNLLRSHGQQGLKFAVSRHRWDTEIWFVRFEFHCCKHLKEQCHISRIFFSFFLAFLQTSYGFSPIKTYKLHYFYLILYSETTDHGEITVTTTFTSGLDLCIFPCFKYIVYQLNSFALVAK